jgi:uncharacterized protein
MAAIFHLAFLVEDLDSTRRFYRDLLGCREGRSTDTWVDFDFFGHQISAHVSRERPAPQPCGQVDGVVVPIPHMGAVLSWAEFEELSRRLEAAGVAWVIAPTIRYRGLPAEQATMFLLDPSGNALELKAYRDDSSVFTP